MYILKVYSIYSTLRQNTNVSLEQNKRYKKCPLFPIHFDSNLRFIYELKHKVCLSKTVRVIFCFRFRFAFIKVYIFVQQNALAV